MDNSQETRPLLRRRLRELGEAVELRRAPEPGSVIYLNGFQTVDESMEQMRLTKLVWTHRQQIARLLDGEITAEAIDTLRSDSDRFVAQAFMCSWVDPAVMENYRERMASVEVALLLEEVVDA